MNFNFFTSIPSNEVKVGVLCLLTYLVFVFLKRFVHVRLSKFASNTSNKFDDLLAQIPKSISKKTIFVVIALFGMKNLQLPSLYLTITTIIMLLFLCSDSVKISKLLAEGVFHIKIKPTKKNKTIFVAIEKIIVVTVILVYSLITLSVFGFNISAILAGLGLGGVAIALAVKNILEDILSAISIYLDQPFSIGDFIVVGELKGEVKKIGLKSTILVSYEGAETVISNKQITSKIIENYGRLKNRIHRYTIGVDYQTTQKQLKDIPKAIEAIINSVDDCEYQACFLGDFNASSLDFTIIFQYKKSGYVDFVKSLEKINLGILEYFKKSKINIPYPTIQLKQ